MMGWLYRQDARASGLPAQAAHDTTWRLLALETLAMALVAAGLLAGCAMPPNSGGQAPATRNAPTHATGATPAPEQRRAGTRTPVAPNLRAQLPTTSIQLGSQPRSVPPGAAVEYTDLSLAGKTTSDATQALAHYLKHGMRCLSSVRRAVPASGAIELAMRQNDPFGSTRFLLLCRGVCDGVRFTVHPGFPSAVSVRDGTTAGYPMIEIGPPKMAQNREQGVSVWRGPDAPPGEAQVELMLVSRNPLAYGAGC